MCPFYFEIIVGGLQDYWKMVYRMCICVILCCYSTDPHQICLGI